MLRLTRLGTKPWSLLVCGLLTGCLGNSAQRLEAVRTAGLERSIAALVEPAIQRGDLPGCVVAIGNQAGVQWLQAYGHRQLQPHREAMTVDTVFDLASLTKPLVTATCMMVLVDRGQVRLDERASETWPEFGTHGKEQVSLRELLLHTSGLIADNDLADYEDGNEIAWQRIADLPLQHPPGTKFVYSDVGYLVAGHIIERVTGKGLDEFAQEVLFTPLGMDGTGFCPDRRRQRRAAPTEMRAGEWLRGSVHDPRSAALGGIAGHAGLFSTAEDLSRLARLYLSRGTWNQQRILSDRAIDVLTRGVAISGAIRSPGFDIKSRYSKNRSDLFGEQAFGHGGFTGTTFWVDPESDLFVIFLSNRLHPDGVGAVNRLAGKIGSVAVAHMVKAPLRSSSEIEITKRPAVATGVDQLQATGCQVLAGQRVGLISNHTGVTTSGQRTVDVLHHAENVELVRLFSPEHGFQGVMDGVVHDDLDPITGLPIVSLYGDQRRPRLELLDDLDGLVFDIQDVGTRFYTYISTLKNCMEVCAGAGKFLMVLDRPNPLNGILVQGPMSSIAETSFTNPHAMPLRHGMTVAEIAKMFQSELLPTLDLRTVYLQNWTRKDYYDQTGLPWVATSPNLRSLHQALLYPGVAMLEFTNVSVGRGTDAPFELMGAPWWDGQHVARRLRGFGIAGLSVTPIQFRPESSTHTGVQCEGVRVWVTDRRSFVPHALGWALAVILRDDYGAQWTGDFGRLLANEELLREFKAGATFAELMELSARGSAKFRRDRSDWLLYP